MAPHGNKIMINIQEKLVDGTSLCGWKSEPPFTPFAPDYAYYFTSKKIFSEEECKEWNDYLLEQEQILLDKFQTSSGDGLTGLGDNSITSRFNHFNLLQFDFHLVPKLKTEIFNGIKTILSISDNTNWQETLYAASWFNVLRKEEFMEVHSHGYHKYSFYGFHVSINAIETVTSYFHPIKFATEAFHIPNKIGHLTLFPNYIPHNVSPNRYETPRISIAGDICPSAVLRAPVRGEDLKGLRYGDKLVEIGTYGNTDQQPPYVYYGDKLVEIGTYNNNNELQEVD